MLHTQRGRWHFTALFSNTARAHELGTVGDWVVIYFHTNSRPENQRTVVTETRGELAGGRVVRGREAECRVAAVLSRTSNDTCVPSRVTELAILVAAKWPALAGPPG